MKAGKKISKVVLEGGDGDDKGKKKKKKKKKKKALKKAQVTYPVPGSVKGDMVVVPSEPSTKELSKRQTKLEGLKAEQAERMSDPDYQGSEKVIKTKADRQKDRAENRSIKKSDKSHKKRNKRTLADKMERFKEKREKKRAFRKVKRKERQSDRKKCANPGASEKACKLKSYE